MLRTVMTSSGALLLVLLASATSGGQAAAWLTDTTEGSGFDMCDGCQSNEVCLRNTDGQTWRCSRYAPELVCGRDYVEVGLLTSQLASSGLDASSAHLADRLCSAHRECDGTTWYRVERKEGSCGNILKTNCTHATYSNTLFVYAVGRSTVSAPTAIPFSCAYPTDTHASLGVAVRPHLAMGGQGISGLGPKAKASMSLFYNASYAEPYPAGRVTLPLGSVLYVGVAAEETEADRFVVVLENCYATHSANPEDLKRYFLIQHKCSTDRRQVVVSESGSSLKARFSALLFLFQGDYRDVFLHCSLSLCDRESSSCTPMCSRRRARSVSSLPIKPLTIGPIALTQN